MPGECTIAERKLAQGYIIIVGDTLLALPFRQHPGSHVEVLFVEEEVLCCVVGTDDEREVVDLMICPTSGRRQFVVNLVREAHTIGCCIFIGMLYLVDTRLEGGFEIIDVSEGNKECVIADGTHRGKGLFSYLVFIHVKRLQAIGQTLQADGILVREFFTIHFDGEIEDVRMYTIGMKFVVIVVRRISLEAHQNRLVGRARIEELVIDGYVGFAIILQADGKDFLPDADVGFLDGDKLIA